MDNPLIKGLRPINDKFPISLGFGVPGTHWKCGYHRGVDFACPEGTPVLAFAAGEVQISKEEDDGFGKRVIILCDGFRYINAHLSQILVAIGEKISAGQILGLSGNTGNTTGPHLHFEARLSDGDVAVKPEFV